MLLLRESATAIALDCLELQTAYESQSHYQTRSTAGAAPQRRDNEGCSHGFHPQTLKLSHHGQLPEPWTWPPEAVAEVIYLHGGDGRWRA